MNEPIETLLFDFGGTLDANGVAWKERFYGFYRAEGLDMVPEAFEPGFFAGHHGHSVKHHNAGEHPVQPARHQPV